jgi:hypothetical protein
MGSMGNDPAQPPAPFDGAVEFARSYRFEMTGEYRALIELVEDMPRNQPGADKSGAWLGSPTDWRAFFDAFSPAPRR